MTKTDFIRHRTGLCTALCLLLFTPGTTAFAQSFGGAFKGMSDNNQPIQIEADRLEVLDNESTALLSGNVSVVQGTTILKASRIKVYYFKKGASGTNASGVKRIEASGKVAVRSENNLATATKAVVDMQSEIVTLTGDVVISQGPNAVTGCTLRVNLKTNEAKLDPCASEGGRVKMILTPKSGKSN